MTNAHDQGPDVQEEQRVEQDIDALLTDTVRERDEYLELAKRTQADFENYRKRVAKESAAAESRGRATLARELLSVADNLERARLPEGTSVSARAVEVGWSGRPGWADVATPVHARALDHPDERRLLAGELRPLIEPGELVVLPAIVGMQRPVEAWSDLQDLLGAVNVRERLATTIARRRGWVVDRVVTVLAVADAPATRSVVRRHPSVFASFVVRRLGRPAIATHDRVLVWVTPSRAARSAWVAGKQRVQRRSAGTP